MTASTGPATFATADLCDANEARLVTGEAHVLPPVFRSYGRNARFRGAIETVRCFEDNSAVRRALEQPGNGRVLVIDGGGSLRCALLGGNLAQLAQRNGWAGVIVDGCVRDTAEIDACEIGVRALAANPRRSEKRGEGAIGEAVRVGGVAVAPGHWCYADEDGILVSAVALL
ncbi:MAG: ribonuclease E activity regulator RraA [Burkholderiaceae bacterium]|jgi:regulator of ribonuclease activity A|nr:ribonuclease E activity regulator RraA [Burkholderiaceae bacterium]